MSLKWSIRRHKCEKAHNVKVCNNNNNNNNNTNNNKVEVIGAKYYMAIRGRGGGFIKTNWMVIEL